jgi:hypothetical protein
MKKNPSAAHGKPALDPRQEKVPTPQAYDPREAAEYYLRDAEGFTAYLRAYWEKQFPAVMEQNGLAVSWHFDIALQHANSLDAHANEAGREGGFLIQFMASIFLTPGFLNALLAVAQVPLDRKTIHPVTSAQRRGQDTRGPFILMRFRESLKDGWSPAQALQIHTESISEELGKGNTALLIGLAAAVKKPPTKSLQEWILNAWLPLALWQPVPMEVKEDRLRQAFLTLSAVGTTMPPWPAATSRNPYPIAKLIGTAASKIKHRRR